MTLTDRLLALASAAIEKYREEIDQCGNVYQVNVVLKVNDRQQPYVTLVGVERKHGVEGVRLTDN